MKILLTGHKGFIGSHLINHLLKKHSVIGIDKPYNLMNCSLAHNVDCVIHLASIPGVRYSLKHPLKVLWNNIYTSYRIFKRFKCPILYASSSTVYEPWRNPYALSKWIVEKIAPPHATGMRFVTVYNKHERPEMFTSLLLRKKLKYVVKDTWRDFIHISDVLTAVDVLISDKDRPRTVDIGTGKSILLETLTDVKKVKRKFYDRKDNKANITYLKSKGWKIK
jgi:UDP-glucose 4-epimerase